MEDNRDKKDQQPAEGLPLASTGNASNPSNNEAAEGPEPAQLIPGRGETYLREGGNIEDLPQPKE